METLQFHASKKKMVTIKIAMEELVRLKKADFQLCVAKQVDGAYNVVWRSSSHFLANNQFEWIALSSEFGPQPQLCFFGTTMFIDDVLVRPMTNSVPIGLGKQTTLNQNGIFEPAMIEGPSASVNFLNQYGAIHPGLSQLCTWIDGTESITPISVKAQPVMTGTTALTPTERVLVWFEQGIEAGMMFSRAQSRAVEIDLTVANTATCRYQNQAWT